MTEQVMVESLAPFIYASSLQVFIGHLLCARHSEGSKESDKACSLIDTVIAEMRRTDTHRWVQSRALGMVQGELAKMGEEVWVLFPASHLAVLPWAGHLVSLVPRLWNWSSAWCLEIK